MRYTIIALLILPFIGCSDEEPLPTCIDMILDDFKIDACDGGDLTTWRFRGDLVYCFNFGACQPDKSIEIYDENCNLICNLAGSTQETICDGISWPDNAFFLSEIYRK